MKETDPRFINLKRKLTLFFSATIIGVIAIFIMLGIERGFFIPKYRIYFRADAGRGLFEGKPVKLSGFTIGKIEAISLDDDAKVRVVLVIFRKYQKWIRQNSRAMLTKEGLFGESVIDVTGGDPKMPVLTDGSPIDFERTKGLDEIAEEMKPLLDDIKGIIAYINDPKGDIKQTLGNIKALSSELRATRENIDRLLKDTDKGVINISADFSKVAASADRTIVSVEGKVIPAIDKLNRAMDNAEKATTDLRDAIEKSAPKIPSLLNKGEDMLDDTGDVVNSLKQVWPIRLFIEEPKGGLIYGDSYE